jgi:hypothetical protein
MDYWAQQGVQKESPTFLAYELENKATYAVQASGHGVVRSVSTVDAEQPYTSILRWPQCNQDKGSKEQKEILNSLANELEIKAMSPVQALGHKVVRSVSNVDAGQTYTPEWGGTSLTGVK